jgi:hypothetical protein
MAVQLFRSVKRWIASSLHSSQRHRCRYKIEQTVAVAATQIRKQNTATARP